MMSPQEKAGAPEGAPASDSTVATTVTVTETAADHDSGAGGQRTGKPYTVPVTIEAIPDELRDLDRWVGWAWTRKDGKWTKPPIKTNGRNASSTNPATWTTFDKAIAAYQNGTFDGIGFVLTEDDDFAGTDLDHCVEDGHIEEWAQEVIDRIGSYTEISPSGTGVRIVVRGKLPPGGRKVDSDGRKIEMYDSGRYLTLTGSRITDTGIEHRQEELEAEHARWFKPSHASEGFDYRTYLATPSLSDAEILDKAMSAANGAKVRHYYNGGNDGTEDGSASAGDLALLCQLAFYTQDPAQLDRLFRGSGRNREKWNRPDYREATIGKALKAVTDTYSPPGPNIGLKLPDGRVIGAEEEDRPRRYLQPVDLLALMAADPPDEEWSVEPLVPARKHTGIVAARGTGKSLLALDIAARKATGQATLGQPQGDPVDTIYLDQEMGPDDLYERLADLGWTLDNNAFGKLVDHLHYYQLVDLPALDTQEGGAALEEIVAHHGAELVVIDTVSRVISGDENSNDTFRELFRHTETRLKRRGVTLIRLDHLGKDLTKGSRGASGKEDALDVVWQLTETATGSLSLRLTKGRQAWIPNLVTVHRDNWNGTLSHAIHEQPTPDWLIDLADLIDSLGLPADAGTPTVQKALRDADHGRRRADIAKAVKFRKGRAKEGTQGGNTPGTPRGNTTGNTPEHPPLETHSDQGLFDREHPPEHPGTVGGWFPPPIGGNTPTPSPQTCTVCDRPGDDLLVIHGEIVHPRCAPNSWRPPDLPPPEPEEVTP